MVMLDTHDGVVTAIILKMLKQANDIVSNQNIAIAKERPTSLRKIQSEKPRNRKFSADRRVRNHIITLPASSFRIGSYFLFPPV